MQHFGVGRELVAGDGLLHGFVGKVDVGCRHLPVLVCEGRGRIILGHVARRDRADGRRRPAAGDIDLDDTLWNIGVRKVRRIRSWAGEEAFATLSAETCRRRLAAANPDDAIEKMELRLMPLWVAPAPQHIFARTTGIECRSAGPG